MVTITATKLKYYILLKREHSTTRSILPLTPYLYSLSAVKKPKERPSLTQSIPKQPEKNISHQNQHHFQQVWTFPQSILSSCVAPPLAAPIVPLSQPRTSRNATLGQFSTRTAPSTKSMNPSGYLKKELKSVYQRRSNKVSTKLPNRIIFNI